MMITTKWYYNDGTISSERDDNKIVHRIDGPAVEFEDGTRCWWINNKCHKTDGPAEEWANGTKRWYINGHLHRIDSPAVEEANGDKCWWINGRLHRIDGPAIEYLDGRKDWYIDWKLYSEEEFNRIVSEAKALEPILQLTDERWWVRELATKNL